jgi:hypothetical protein
VLVHLSVIVSRQRKGQEEELKTVRLMFVKAVYLPISGRVRIELASNVPQLPE